MKFLHILGSIIVAIIVWFGIVIISYEGIFHKDGPSTLFALAFIVPAYKITYDRLTKKRTIKEAFTAAGDSIGAMSRWLTPLMLFIIAFVVSVQSNNIRSINYDISSMRSDINSIESNIGSIEGDTNSISSSANSIEYYTNDLESKLDDINTKLGYIDSSLDSIKYDVDSLKSDVGYLKYK